MTSLLGGKTWTRYQDEASHVSTSSAVVATTTRGLQHTLSLLDETEGNGLENVLF